MDILTLNCGSSSLKYQLYRWDDRDILSRGIVERVGVGGSFISHYSKRTGANVKIEHDCPRKERPCASSWTPCSTRSTEPSRT